MAVICDCNLSLGNTGVPGCVPIQNVISSLILVRMKNNDGDRNGLDLTQTFTPATFTALVNEPDASKRWYPLPEMEEVGVPKDDDITQEYSSGKTVKIRDGKRAFSGMITGKNASPEYVGKLETAGCVDFGFYMVDIEGQLIGDYNSTDNYFYPVPADQGSWSVIWNPADGVNNTEANIMVKFNWSRLYKDKNLKILTPTEAGGQDFTELEGLIDVIFSNETAVAASTTFDAAFIFGTAQTPKKYIGADQTTDWSIYNETTMATVVIDSVTESSLNTGGETYELAHAVGVTATDVITVSVTRNGFSGSATYTVA